MAEDPTKTLNPRPVARAFTVAPDPELYEFVVRRTDRFARSPQRVMVSYTKGQAVSRDITTPWDGTRAATLFLRDERERRRAFELGWRDNITEKFKAHLDENGQPLPPREPAPVRSKGAKASAGPLSGAAALVEGSDAPHEGDAGGQAAPIAMALLADADYPTLQRLAKEHGLNSRQSARKLKAELAAFVVHAVDDEVVAASDDDGADSADNSGVV